MLLNIVLPISKRNSSTVKKLSKCKWCQSKTYRSSRQYSRDFTTKQLRVRTSNKNSVLIPYPIYPFFPITRFLNFIYEKSTAFRIFLFNQKIKYFLKIFYDKIS